MGKSSVRAAAVAAVLAALSVLSVGADEELQMEKIVVTATRTATAILDSPDHVTVIEGDELAAAGTATLAEALNQVAGVAVKDNGTAGSVQSLRIRGSESPQVLVLVDGVRLNDSRQGGVDLSQIPVGSIERIEVLRGGTSALYGADALGGVINIITRSRAEKLLTLRVQNGGYLPREAIEVSEGPTETAVGADYLDLLDTQKLDVQLSKGLDGVEVLAGGSFLRAANGFVWNDEQYIDDYRRQVNAGLLQAGGTLSVRAPLGEAAAGLKAQMDYSSVGVPGSLTWVSTDASQQRAALQGQVYYQNPQLTQSLSLEARAFYKLTRLAYQDPDPMFPTDDVHTLHTVGLSLLQQAAVAGFLELVYGGDFSADLAESTAIGSKRRFTGGAFLEAPLYAGERFTLTPVVRCDLYSDFPASLTYKLAAVARLSEQLSLKASAGRSYRAPTLNELYWPNDGMSEGNPDLSPESGYSGELGLSVAAGRLQANAFAFVRHVLDGIQWVETSPFFYQPTNIGEALFPGVEADLSLSVLGRLRLSSGYTFLHSYVLESPEGSYTLGDDRRAAYAPVHTADAALQYDDGRTRLRVEGELVGERFTGVEGETLTQTLDPYFVLNAEARWELTPNLTLSVAGRNLLNQVYQTSSGYVMPPLSIWVGAELSFEGQGAPAQGAPRVTAARRRWGSRWRVAGPGGWPPA